MPCWRWTHTDFRGPDPAQGTGKKQEAQRPSGALRDKTQVAGKKTQKRRAVSLARGGLPAAPLRNTGPSEAAEQGRGRLSGPSPDNPCFVPAASDPAQPPPCPESEAAGLAARLGGRQPRLGRRLRQAMGSSNNPSQDLGAGLTEAHPGLTTQRGLTWPHRPACGGHAAGQACHRGGLSCRACPEAPAHSVSKDFLQSPGQTRDHHGGGPYPPPRPSMALAGAGHVRPALQLALGASQRPWGAWGSEPLERQSPGSSPAVTPDREHRTALQGTRRPRGPGGLLHGGVGQAHSGAPGATGRPCDPCGRRPRGAPL